MSTEIKSAYRPEVQSLELGPLIGYEDAPRVFVRVRGESSWDGDRVLINVHRADFLAAVETECGVRIVPADDLVIERAELPKVMASGGCTGGGVHFLSAAGHEITDTADPALVRVHAHALLALAEYLAAHPPVPPVSDEDVETLAGLLNEVDPEGVELTSLTARRLLATGRVSVTHA